MKIVVTIPAYNEEKTIGKVISDIARVMDSEKYRYEILVIDDGSKDRTAEVAKKAGAKVYSHPKNYGLAEAFRTEIEKSLEHKADVIVHTDADGQYRAEEIPKLVREIENGAELVLGSRFRGKIESMPFIKKFGNRAFSKVVSSVSGMKISDAQTGFRAFTREVAEKVRISSIHTYTQEQIIRAVRMKFRVVEIPIYFAKRGDGKSRLMSNPFEYAAKAWITIFRIYRDYEPLKFFGYIGSLLFLIGFVLGVFVLYTFLSEGVVGGIPRVILSASFMLAGIQVILFGFLADMMKG